MINPMICFNCQTVICKECLEGSSKKYSSCPMCRKDISDYKRSIEKNNFLNFLLFKCRDCNKTIRYEEGFFHKKLCNNIKYSKGEIVNIKKNSKINPEKESVLKKLFNKEFQKLKGQNFKTLKLNCKYF